MTFDDPLIGGGAKLACLICGTAMERITYMGVYVPSDAVEARVAATTVEAGAPPPPRKIRAVGYVLCKPCSELEQFVPLIPPGRHGDAEEGQTP